MKSHSIPSIRASRATILATSFGLVVVSHANDIFKADTNASPLSDGASWTGGVAPGSGDVAVWNSTVTAASSPLLGGDLSWAGIRIADPGGPVSISAGNTLGLGVGGIDMSAATQNLTLQHAITLGDAQTWGGASGRMLLATGAVDNGGFLLTVTGSGSRSGASPYVLSGITEISGVLSGVGGLTKTSGGNLILSGSSANTFTGVTDIRGGNVFLNKPADTNAIAGNVVIYASHLHLSASNQLANTAVIGNYSRTSGGQATFDLRGFNETIAGLESTGENTSNGNGRLVVQRFDNAGAGGNSNSAVDSTLTLSDSADHSFYGFMRNTDDGSSGKLNVIKEGSGRQLFGPRDAGAGSTATHTTYTGTTTINGGTLVLQNMFTNNNAWQSAITINTGGTLELLQGTAGPSMNDAVSGAGVMTKTGSQATTLTATALHTGGTQVKAGSLVLAGSANNRLATTAPLTLGDTATAGKLALGNAAGASNQEIGALASTGLGGSVVGGNAAASTLTFTAASGTSVFTGSLGGSGTNENSLAITKLGAGQFVVNGTASYSGATTVGGGSLLLNNPSGTLSAVSLASGTGFGRSTPGSLSVNSLTLGASSGDTATLFTTLGGPASLVVTSAGGLVANGGAASVTVNVGGAVAATGTYTLIDYAGSLGGGFAAFQLGSLPPRMGATLVDNVANASIDLNVTSLDSARWNGDQGQDWTMASNWVLDSNGTTTTSYIENDSVVFADAATGSTDIVIGQTDVSPSLITFNNSTKDYTLTQQNGKDILSGSLVKSGSGKLTISGSFSFPGGATLNGGTVSFNNVGGLGTGARTFNGGTLEYTGATGTLPGSTTLGSSGGTIKVTDSAAVLTQAGSLIPGNSGSLTKDGPGTLVLPLTTGTYANAIQIADGTLNLNYGSSAAVCSGNITGAASSILRLDGTGADANNGLTLTGNNTFAGDTHLYGRRVFLDSPVGNAISGNIVVKQANWPSHCLTLLRNEQIADTAVISFDSFIGDYDFRLNGKTETLAGIVSIDDTGIIENAGTDGSNDTGITNPGTLIVSGPDSYSFFGALRNQNGGTNGVLQFTKSGAGTQTLSGTGITYTGSTTVNSGTLKLMDATAFASNITLNGGNLELSRSSGAWNFAKTIAAGSGAGNVKVTGFGTVTLSGANTYTGATTIESGTLSVTGSIAGSPLIDVLVDGTLSSTTVGSGQTVRGTGSLSSVTFGNGSTLTPGTATTIDTIQGAGTITLQAGSSCAMQVDRTSGVITNDQLTNMTAITYGGTLTVTATGTAFANGDVIPLFPGATTYGGSFSTVNLPTLSSGLSWDLSGLTANGSIQVVNTTPTPVFNPPAGGYVGAQTVSISSDTGSTIYYTMDGSTPTTSSPSGLSPVSGLSVPTNSTVTIKAFAKKTGQGDSPIATSVYTTLDTPTWIADLNGSWQDAFNWQGGVIAQGTGVTADFSTLTTTGFNDVSLDGLRTVGKLIFGDQGNQYAWTVSPGSGGSLTLNNGANAPVIDVINQSVTISAGVTSSNGLRKQGAGTLSLAAANSITGTLEVAAGTLNIGATGAIASGANIVLGTSGSIDPTFQVGTPGSFSFGSVTVPAGVTGATFAMPQNGSSANHPVAGATLGSPLTVAQSNASSPNWSQITWTSKLTGNGGGSGNDTLVFNNTSTMQNYFTMGADVINDFVGNVRVKGYVSAQSGSVGSNYMIPDASMLIIESGQWRWNQGGFVETIDGLAGAGPMTNPGNVTLTIDASNADNHGDRTFTGSLGTMGGTFTKNGPGTQTFSGTGITYTNATTINGGTLELSETTSFASSTVTVNGGKLLVSNTTGTGTGTTAAITVKTGATLAGTGSVGGTATIEANGIVAPGNGGIGTLTLNAANMFGGYQCQLDGATGDSLTVTNALLMDSAATITVSTVGTPTAASYTILSYGSLVGSLPTITGVPAGYSVDTSTAGQVKLVSGNAFDSWINGFTSLTNPADKTPTADPDNDGLANVVEFVLDGNPTSGTITNLPTVTASGANVVFTYTRRDDSESLAQAVEFDADLAGTWTTAADGSNCTIVVTENGTNPDTVTVTIPKGANTKLFARLKVTP